MAYKHYKKYFHTEVMLYDPAEPGTGQFYEWIDWENRYIGRTGYGRYWLWRPLQPDE